MMKKIIFILFFCVSVLASEFAGAETTTYTVASQVRNKSQVASYVLSQSKTFAKEYAKYKNIHVFANDAPTTSFLMDVTQDVYEQIADDLGIEKIKKEGIYFTIFGLSDSAWRSFGLPDGVAALYTRGHNEIYVRLKHSSRSAIQSTLAHELTHLVIDNIDPRAALWFHEGMAQFQSEKVFGQHKKRGVRYLDASTAVKRIEHSSFSLDQLVAAKDYPRDVKLFYEVSYQIISFISHNGTMNTFSRNYLQYKASFISSLKQSVGYSFNSTHSFQQALASFVGA